MHLPGSSETLYGVFFSGSISKSPTGLYFYAIWDNEILEMNSTKMLEDFFLFFYIEGSIWMYCVEASHIFVYEY